MRRVAPTSLSREHCLRQAVECDWGAEHAATAKARAQAWDQARWWRSLALVATPLAPPRPSGEGAGRC